MKNVIILFRWPVLRTFRVGLRHCWDKYENKFGTLPKLIVNWQGRYNTLMHSQPFGTSGISIDYNSLMSVQITIRLRVCYFVCVIWRRCESLRFCSVGYNEYGASVNRQIQGKQKYWMTRLSQCQFVNHKSRTDWPGIKRAIPAWAVARYGIVCSGV